MLRQKLAEPARLWRSASASSRLLLLAGVFFLFAIVGLLSDLMSAVQHGDWWHLAFTGLFSGALSAAYVLAIVTHRGAWLPLVVIVQIAYHDVHRQLEARLAGPGPHRAAGARADQPPHDRLERHRRVRGVQLVLPDLVGDEVRPSLGPARHRAAPRARHPSRAGAADRDADWRLRLPRRLVAERRGRRRPGGRRRARRRAGVDGVPRRRLGPRRAVRRVDGDGQERCPNGARQSHAPRATCSRR